MPNRLVDEIKRHFAASVGTAAGAILLLVLVAAGQATSAAEEQPREQPAGATELPPPAPSGLVVGNVDVGKELSGVLDSLNQALKTVTDAASAKAVLPKITEIRASLDKLEKAIGQLSDSGKATLSDLVAKALPAEKASLDRLYGIPGVADVLNPTLDPVLSTLNDAARKPD